MLDISFEYFILAFLFAVLIFLYSNTIVDYFWFKKRLKKIEFEIIRNMNEAQNIRDRISIAQKGIRSVWDLEMDSKTGIFDKLFVLFRK